jgi:hypothetical protein
MRPVKLREVVVRLPVASGVAAEPAALEVVGYADLPERLRVHLQGGCEPPSAAGARKRQFPTHTVCIGPTALGVHDERGRSLMVRRTAAGAERSSPDAGRKEGAGSTGCFPSAQVTGAYSWARCTRSRGARPPDTSIVVGDVADVRGDGRVERSDRVPVAGRAVGPSPVLRERSERRDHQHHTAPRGRVLGRIARPRAEEYVLRSDPRTEGEPRCVVGSFAHCWPEACLSR